MESDGFGAQMDFHAARSLMQVTTRPYWQAAGLAKETYWSLNLG